MKHWIYFRKHAFPVLLALTAVLFLLTGCFGRSASDEEQEIEASAEEEQEEYEQAFDGDYPGTVAAREAAADEAPYYGIMYATILDINGSGMDSSTVYSFKDKNDPDNAWSVTGLEVGDIETSVKNRSVKEAVKILDALPESLRKQITKVTAKTQDSVTTELNNGEHSVVWGDSSDIELKKADVDKILSDPNVIGDKTQVDVSSPYHPVLR